MPLLSDKCTLRWMLAVVLPGLLGTLEHRAQKAGTVRSGLTAGEVIALAVGLAWAAQQPGAPTNSMARLLSTAMHGLAVPL
jgi:hypothetical protein